MLLVIDIGNTNVVAAVFNEAQMVAKIRFRSETRMTDDEFTFLLGGLLGDDDVDPATIEGVMISSVVPALSGPATHAASALYNVAPVFLTPEINLGLEIKYDNPHYVGADRLADAIGVGEIYGGPAIIVDFGTATTVDAIDGAGAYLGGAIAPGLEASHDALVQRAALLPRIPLTAPDQVIGTDVITSMQSGLVIGYAAMIEGLVTRAIDEVGGSAKVVATGGLATVIADLTNVIDIVDPDITLSGIRIAYERHQQFT